MSFTNRPRRLVLRSPNGSRIELDADEATIKMYGLNGQLLAVFDAALEAFGQSIFVQQVFDFTGALVAQFGGLVIKVVGTDGSANLSAGSSGDVNSLPRLELILPGQTVSAIVQAEDVADNGGTLTIRTPSFSTHDVATIVLKSETDVLATRMEVTAATTLFTGDVQLEDLTTTGGITSAGANTLNGDTTVNGRWFFNFHNWAKPALQNGWTNRGGGFPDFQYRKTPTTNHVQLLGEIVPGTLADGTLIATLPVGFRPADPQMVPARKGAAATCYFQVNSNGQILIFDAAGSGLVQLTPTIIPLDTLT